MQQGLVETLLKFQSNNEARVVLNPKTKQICYFYGYQELHRLAKLHIRRQLNSSSTIT